MSTRSSTRPAEACATTHYFSRTFENAVGHANAVYQACAAKADLAPDMIIGHSGFGSTVFLPELFTGVPIINYSSQQRTPWIGDEKRSSAT